jgi:hypothetical protein
MDHPCRQALNENTALRTVSCLVPSNPSSDGNDVLSILQRFDRDDSNVSPAPLLLPPDGIPLSCAQKLDDPPSLVTQPSPPAPEQSSVTSKLTTPLRQDNHGTPCRRTSKRVRTPSAKKMEWIETEQRLVASRKKPTRKPKQLDTRNADPASEKPPIVDSRSVAPIVDPCTKGTIDVGFKPSAIFKPLSLEKAPSPIVGQLNVEKPASLSQSVMGGMNVGDVAGDDMEWASAAPPTSFFGEMTPPPKRNARIRTPFSKLQSGVDHVPSAEEMESACLAEAASRSNTSSTMPSAPQTVQQGSSTPIQSERETLPASVAAKVHLRDLDPAAVDTTSSQLTISLPDKTSSIKSVDKAYSTSRTPRRRKPSTGLGSLRRSSRRASLCSPFASQTPSSCATLDSRLKADSFRGVSPMATSNNQIEPPTPPQLTSETSSQQPASNVKVESAGISRSSSQTGTLAVVEEDTRQATTLSVDFDSSSDNSVCKFGNAQLSSLSVRHMDESPVEQVGTAMKAALESPSENLFQDEQQSMHRSAGTSTLLVLNRKEPPSCILVSSVSSKVGKCQEQRKRRQGSRRSSFSSPSFPLSRDVDKISCCSQRSSSIAFDDDEKPAKRRRSSRRASVAVLSSYPKLKHIEETPTTTALSKENDSLNRREGSSTEERHARTSLLLTDNAGLPPLPPFKPKAKPTQAPVTDSVLSSTPKEATASGNPQTHIPTPTTVKRVLPPLPTSTLRGQAGHCSASTSSIRLSAFKLPPLPTGTLSSNRTTRRTRLSTGSPSSREWIGTSPSIDQNSKLHVSTNTTESRSSSSFEPAFVTAKSSEAKETPSGFGLQYNHVGATEAVEISTTVNKPTTANDVTTPSAPIVNVSNKALKLEMLHPKDLNIGLPRHTMTQTPTSSTSPIKQASTYASRSLSERPNSAPVSSSQKSARGSRSTKERLVDLAEHTPVSGSTLEEDLLPPILVPAATIRKKACRMFANGKIARYACVSARIFACFDLSQPNISCEVAVIAAKRAQSSIAAPLLQLMTSIVSVEMTALDEQDESKATTGRKVHFSGFDCSSTHPPSDARAGSQSHQKQCIAALVQATQQIQSIADGRVPKGAKPCDRTILFASLESLVNFLSSMLVDTRIRLECAQVSLHATWRRFRFGAPHLNLHRCFITTCCKSIEASYPPKRLIKAIQVFKGDFECILQRMRAFSGGRQLDYTTATSLERRLSELTGQAIRFHLRQLFNPAPNPLTRGHVTKTKLLSGSERKSNIFDLVDLVVPDAGRDSAVADGSISSLFSLALRRIYDYFGMDAFSPATTHSIPLPNSFCSSPASQRGLGTAKNPAKNMSPEELSEFVEEIGDVFRFLACFHACKFLVGLISAPGVAQEIQKMGAWSAIDQYAKSMREHDLIMVCVEDSHLAIAHSGTIERFFLKVEDWLLQMEPKVALADISIKQLSKRYRAKATSPRQRGAIYRKFPYVKKIAEAIDEGETWYCSFPVVKPIP